MVFTLINKKTKIQVMEISSFHTHTKLCKHATGMPVDYLEEAKAFLKKYNYTCKGFGFSDHCPYPNDGTDNWPEVRMTTEEAPDYIKAVREAAKTVDFPVIAGFECEWDSMYKSWYKDFLLSELGADYLVLGSHWTPLENERNYIPNDAKMQNFLQNGQITLWKLWILECLRFLLIQICVLVEVLFGQKTQKAFFLRFLLFVKKKMLLLKLTDMEF